MFGLWARTSGVLLLLTLGGVAVVLRLGAVLPAPGVVSYTVYDHTRMAQVELLDISRGSTYRPIRTPVDVPIAWSPDGRHLAFVPAIDGRGFLMVEDVFSGQQEVIADALIYPNYIAWSPDGQWLGFTIHDEIWAYNVQERDTRRFADPGNVLVMAWSADSTRFVYTSRQGMNTHIYLHDMDTGRDRLLVQSDELSFGTYSPVFSPDDCCIAYILNAGMEFRVQMYEFATDSEREIFRGESISSLSWSPDGAQILFSQMVPGQGYHIYTYNFPTDSVHRVTHGIGNHEFPQWVPW